MNLKSITYTVIAVLTLFGCSNDQEVVKEKYIGHWQKVVGGKNKMEIYEENGGLFVKYPKGTVFPLKYQEEGQYYGIVDIFGDSPLLIKDDTLIAQKSKYIKIK